MKSVKTAMILMFLLAGNLVLSAAIPASERQALIDLYNSTHGDAWFNKAGWKTPPLAGYTFNPSSKSYTDVSANQIQNYPATSLQAQYNLLHAFSGGPSDGTSPNGSLTKSGDVLYGMTRTGGSANLGTIFKINTDGTGYSLLYNFTGGANGTCPNWSLVLVGSNLYGVTDYNGIFKINTNGEGFTFIHQWAGGVSDGGSPQGSLITDGNFLYGITAGGGTYNGGIVYKVKTDGSEFSVIHSFSGFTSDGGYPAGSLILGGTVLYGVTQQGGDHNIGTVFKLNTDGSGFSLLHSFSTDASNGRQPLDGLALINSTLFGMTYIGGARGLGTIFKINTDGTGFGLLHSFNGANGYYPYGLLIACESTLYGMASNGGAVGNGAIFKINANGSGFELLHSFPSDALDGKSPLGSLIGSGSTIYGMTSEGGISGRGVIFSQGVNEIFAQISLSKTSLAFCAVVGGPSTSSQPVVVSNSGGGTLAWTVASNQGWYSVAPGSGTGTGTVIVSVNAPGLAAGTYSGMVNVMATGTSNSPQMIAVTLNVIASGTSALPFGEFSTPLTGTNGITGAIPVTGWVLDDIETMKVEIKRDSVAGDPPGAIGPDGLVYLGDAIFVEGARPDVEQAYPGYPLNYRAGWGYMLLTNFLPSQGNGTFKICAYAYDKEGNKVLLGTKTITCSNATATKPFGTIDTPAQGGDVSGSAYVNFGWVLTPQPSEMPKDGSTISAWVDGVQMGVLKDAPNSYNQYRADIAGLFPGLKNSGGPVGFVYLNTTLYSNGVHTIYWIATDDAGHADGIGSRYFNVLNAGTPSPQSNQANQTMDLSGSDSSDSAMNLPVSFEPRRVKKGFDLNAEPDAIRPDEYGVVHINIGEVERVELDLKQLPREVSGVFGSSEYSGFLLVGNRLRPLPIGSTLDQRKGTFSWLPGPGFLGEYQFVFIRKNRAGVQTRISVKVMITPIFGLR